VVSEFVGRGWAFPLSVAPSGGIATVGGEDDVERSMRLVLGTALGERPMRPEYGCSIHDLVFAPVDPTFAGVVAYGVRLCLVRWEPRIEVVDVRVTQDPEQVGTVFVEIDYVVRTTNDRRNLVFPFYSIPEEH